MTTRGRAEPRDELLDEAGLALALGAGHQGEHATRRPSARVGQPEELELGLSPHEGHGLLGERRPRADQPPDGQPAQALEVDRAEPGELGHGLRGLVQLGPTRAWPGSADLLQTGGDVDARPYAHLLTVGRGGREVHDGLTGLHPGAHREGHRHAVRPPTRTQA